MSVMNNAATEEIVQHLLAIRGWIEHWQRDRESKLVPTFDALVMGRAHADTALTLVRDHWFKARATIEGHRVHDLIAELREGVPVAEETDNGGELYDIEAANETMAHAARVLAAIVSKATEPSAGEKP
jgi:hypothetical protein